MLDRIDLHVEVPKVPHRALRAAEGSESGSAVIRQRVTAARHRQLSRTGKLNQALSPKELDQFCPIDKKATALLELAVDRLGLSARAYHRVLKVARTIADLENAATIDTAHLSEAVSYRRLDRRPLAAVGVE